MIKRYSQSGSELKFKSRYHRGKFNRSISMKLFMEKVQENIFYIRILQIPWTKRVNNNEVLKKNYSRKSKNSESGKYRWTHYKEFKFGKFNPHLKEREWWSLGAFYLTCLCKWIVELRAGALVERKKKLLSATKDRNLWIAMIDYILNRRDP